MGDIAHEGNGPFDQLSEARKFLAALWGKYPRKPGTLVLWTRQDKLSRSIPAADLEQAATTAVSMAGSMDVYAGVGLQADDLPATQRGTEKTVVAIPGFWLDVDVQGPNHKASNLPPTTEAALGLLTEAYPEVPPTMILATGGGLQAYWLFPEPWLLADDAARAEAKSAVKAWWGICEKAAKLHGWKLDGTCDLARVFRVAGTFNRKQTEPRPVKIIDLTDARYGREQLRAVVDAQSPLAACGSGDIKPDEQGGVPGDAMPSGAPPGDDGQPASPAQVGPSVAAEKWERYVASKNGKDHFVGRDADGVGERTCGDMRYLCHDLGIPVPDAIKMIKERGGLVRDDPAYWEKYVRQYCTMSAKGHLAGSKPKPPSQSEVMAALAQDAELFHTPDGEPLAMVRVDGCLQTWRLRSKGFRNWLVGRYYRQTRKAPGGQAVQDALDVLQAKAVCDGEEHPVHVRVAEHDGKIYIDLADEKWRVIEITAEGWRVLPESPVRFIRTKAMLPLPTPAEGGNLDELRNLVNCPNDTEWAIVLSWLVGCLHPRGPYSILAVNGEQGSAKSTLCKMLRRLIDPNKAELRAEPKDVRDLMIAAGGSWVYALDNVSGIQPWLSDALCRLSNGAGYGTRELYSDEGETVFVACRPIVLNGIEDLATRSDLLDRCLSVCLPTISEEQRREEQDVWTKFEAAHPRILGGLLDAVVAAMRNRDAVVLTSKPRMADHARWAVAAEAALGLKPGAVMAAISQARADADAIALESHPVAPTLLAFMEGKTTWEGAANELLACLEARFDADNASTGAGAWSGKPHKRPWRWPTSPKALSVSLRYLAPNLRRVGLEVQFDREKDSSRKRVIRLSRVIMEPAAPETTDAEPPMIAPVFMPKRSFVDDDDCVPARQGTVDDDCPF